MSYSNGWNRNAFAETGLMKILEDIYNLEYEIKNCIRGSYTNCETNEELGKRIQEYGSRLAGVGNTIQYMREDD